MNTFLKRYFLFGFKHIRFKFSSQSVVAKESEPRDVLLIRTLKLAELLDCTTYTAREIISRNGTLLTTSSFEFIQNAKFCGQFLKLSDVVELPCLLTLNPSLLLNRFLSLQELGFSNISGNHILRYQQLLKKSPNVLSKEGLKFCAKGHLETMKRFVPLEEREDFWDRLECLHAEGTTPLSQLKECANAEALAVKLGCSLSVTNHMFRCFPPLKTHSTANMLRVLDILRDEYRFLPSKIQHSPRVLSLHPEALLEILEQLPSFLGVDTTELARRVPALLRLPTQRLLQVEGALREGGVQGGQLLCCPKAALLCPRTLRARLQALQLRPELRLLRPHRRFLWLAYYFGRLEGRLGALPPDAPVSIAAFTTSEDNFRRSLIAGEQDDRRCSTEALAYLAEAVGAGDVAARLPPQARPRLPNCSRVVEFLRAQGVSRAQLLHGLEATLYDEAVVRAHWAALAARPQWAEWAAHYNLLQLLVYAIEVESGFRGRAVNRTSLSSEYAF